MAYIKKIILPDGNTYSLKDTSAVIYGYTSVTVDTSLWEEDSTYSGYPYRASIACSGVSILHSADVVFSPEDCESGIFCPITNTYTGGVYIYASSIPTSTITIPLIKCESLTITGSGSGSTTTSWSIF